MSPNNFLRAGGVFCLLYLFGFLVAAQMPDHGLQITYTNNGLAKLSYDGTVLEDLTANPSDAFQIGHMKITDLKGNLKTGDQYVWGEVNNGKRWDSLSHTWNYQFIWGSVSAHFLQTGDNLNIEIAIKNQPASGVIVNGVTTSPLVLHFPDLPVGFKNPKFEQLASNLSGPSVTLADYRKGAVAAVYADAARPLYTGFHPAAFANAYTLIVSGTKPDGIPVFFPALDRPTPPGRTDDYVLSLRFAPSGKPLALLARDVYQNWRKTWPSTLHWTDRRILGTIYLATSPPDNTGPGYGNNPRRYFNNGKAADFDITNPAGLQKFQQRMLQQANAAVENMKKLNAQGSITWDIEGEQFPQSTSFVCAPDLISQVAPEMETLVSEAGSPYHGMKLADAYFKTMRDGGFRVGVCVRPQHFVMHPDGTASQETLPAAAVSKELTRKIQYAKARWGATIFYIDSNVDETGRALSAATMSGIAAAFPDCLLIPEQSDAQYYASTAPFLTFLFHRDLGTPSDIYNFYPQAFSANMVNDVDAHELSRYLPQLKSAVQKGDILMVHADYWQANNATIADIYKSTRNLTKNR
jgi:hypothetical protein